MMESVVPAKRIRLEYSSDSVASDQNDDFQCYVASSDLSGGSSSSGSSVGVDGSQTCDSGFNELTPPRCLEEDPASSGVSYQPHGVKRKSSDDDEVSVPRAVVSPTPPNNQPTSTASSSQSNKGDEEESPAVIGGGDDSSDDDKLMIPLDGDDGQSDDESGPALLVQQLMRQGQNPRTVLSKVLGSTINKISSNVTDEMLWLLFLKVLIDEPRRERLRHINTLQDAVRLIKTSRKILVVTGAGVSVSCGIPDFRSCYGCRLPQPAKLVWLQADLAARLQPDPMFDISFFRKDPRPFFKFAREIYSGQFTPSLCHRFIRSLESHDRLLRNYTQNIDALEQVADITNVIQCYGSFATATCQRCSYKVSAEDIKEDIFAQRIPMCPQCTPPASPTSFPPTSTMETDIPPTPPRPTSSPTPPPSSKSDPSPALPTPLSPSNLHFSSPPTTTSPSHQHNSNCSTTPSDPQSPTNSGCCASSHPGCSIDELPSLQPIMKPDIVFRVPVGFHDSICEDQDQCDLLIVIGSSLKLRPVALIPTSIPSNVPQILINREPPLSHLTFDIELLGDCDVIVNELCHRLGGSWQETCADSQHLREIRELRAAPQAPNLAPHPTDAPHPRDEDDIEALRACWAPKVKESVADKLPEHTFYYNGAHRYVFKGAEVFYDPDDDIDDDDDDSASETSATSHHALQDDVTTNVTTEHNITTVHHNLPSNGATAEIINNTDSLSKPNNVNNLIEDCELITSISTNNMTTIEAEGGEDSSYHSPTRLDSDTTTLDELVEIVQAHRSGRFFKTKKKL